jgi:hypothetical protein
MNLNDVLTFIANFNGEQNNQVSTDDITTLHCLASMALLQAEYLFARTIASESDAETQALSVQDHFLAAFPFPRWSETAKKLSRIWQPRSVCAVLKILRGGLFMDPPLFY